MTNDSRNMAARCAMLLAERIEQIRDELRADPAYERCVGDPMIVGLLLVLCNSVMHEDNWSQRGLSPGASGRRVLRCVSVSTKCWTD